ncbi:MAG TPA: hypothetical protein VMC06_12970 [Opitutaceae bacterium]|nr:hypothetical protein [Opitutaceae bacterium]
MKTTMKRHLTSVALLLTLVVGAASGPAAISQTPTVTREQAAVRASLNPKQSDLRRGSDGGRASAKYLPEQYVAAQLPLPSPTAWVWDLAGLRPF